MPKIFISYRREDSEYAAHSIYERLVAHYGEDSVFMDVHTIPFGVDFRKHLSNEVGRCQVFLAVIGDHWLNACFASGPRKGERRLDDPEDFVRIEVESALERDIPVIPVLVGRALVPEANHLPQGLKEFSSRNATPVRAGADFGEQDCFAFLIDPTGWVEIGNQSFAPGFFTWNSEVGKRSVGIQTFWFQSVCRNHIVWDAVDVVEFSRKHTGQVSDSLTEIRRLIEGLIAKRDQRQDGFVGTIRKAMEVRPAETTDEATTFLLKQGLTRSMVKQAVNQIAARGELFTLWNMVDALTQLTGQITYAGDRTEADQKVARLLALAV